MVPIDAQWQAVLARNSSPKSDLLLLKNRNYGFGPLQNHRQKIFHQLLKNILRFLKIMVFGKSTKMKGQSKKLFFEIRTYLVAF